MVRRSKYTPRHKLPPSPAVSLLSPNGYNPSKLHIVYSPTPILRRLWLDDNKLSTFPECVLNLEGLEVLRLQNNDLKSIPPQIRVLRSLRELAADNNELVEVPDTLTELTCLAKLMLRQNR